MKLIPSPLTEEEHLLLNEVISSSFGISFPEHKRPVLEARLRPRLIALRMHRFMDYYLHLQCDHDGERQRLAELVTNNETFFFRETHHFEALFENALEGKGGIRESSVLPGELRVLCAGCSSGEEPYTLGILARQNLVRLAGLQLSIDAFDIDRNRIDMARLGEYGKSSLRSLDPEQIERLFTPAPPLGLQQRWSLRPGFRAPVRFSWGNILDLSSFRAATPYDVVFCRNVLIYFSEVALHSAVQHFAQVLRPGGLLFLGSSESIIGLTDRFETLRLHQSIAYRKVK